MQDDNDNIVGRDVIKLVDELYQCLKASERDCKGCRYENMQEHCPYPTFAYRVNMLTRRR